MRKMVLAGALAMMANVAQADPAVGVWTSPTNGDGASIKLQIVKCQSGICGVIHSVTNGDPSIVGKTMVWGMKPQGGGKYTGGKVWAPDDDKTYNGKLTLTGNGLKVEGCILGFCRGETFSR